jgi:hypothetical protein
MREDTSWIKHLYTTKDEFGMFHIGFMVNGKKYEYDVASQYDADEFEKSNKFTPGKAYNYIKGKASNWRKLEAYSASDKLIETIESIYEFGFPTTVLDTQEMPDGKTIVVKVDVPTIRSGGELPDSCYLYADFLFKERIPIERIIFKALDGSREELVYPDLALECKDIKKKYKSTVIKK